jgi:stress-induced morphogen
LELERIDPLEIDRHVCVSMTNQFLKTNATLCSRNNGFLNMLAVMKRKAAEAEARGEQAAASEIEFVEEMGRPMYNSMMKKLINFLKPKSLTLEDESAQHAGHAGSRGLGGESHFKLNIVADCFDGLTLVQRHKLIYTVLAQEMTQIHALSIDSKTPAEAGMQ